MMLLEEDLSSGRPAQGCSGSCLGIKAYIVTPGIHVCNRACLCSIYIPLPNEEGRAAIMSHLLKGSNHALSLRDFEGVVRATDGYSASDLTALCKCMTAAQTQHTLDTKQWEGCG
jgi:hypothetical protein